MNRPSRIIIALALSALTVVGCDPSIWPIHGGGGKGGNPVGQDIATILGDTWKLTGFQERIGNALSFEEVPSGIEYTLIFGEDRRAGGMADCKAYSYAYRTKPGERTIRFSEPAPQIAIVCDNHELEARFYNGIEGARNYMIDGEKLVLYYGSNGEKALHFERIEKNVTGDVKPVEFVPFSLTLHHSRPYTLEYPTLGGGTGRERVRIENDILFAPVQYSGGCEDHDFDLFANEDPRVLPIGAGDYREDLHLIHSSKPDMCEALVSEIRLFDLKPLRDFYRENGVTSGVIKLTIHTLDGSGETATVEYPLD